MPRPAWRCNLGAGPTTPWSKVLCYAGLGAGEVTVAGRKVVGMSQRRERLGCLVPHDGGSQRAGSRISPEVLSGPERRSHGGTLPYFDGDGLRRRGAPRRSLEPRRSWAAFPAEATAQAAFRAGGWLRPPAGSALAQAVGRTSVPSPRLSGAQMSELAVHRVPDGGERGQPVIDWWGL